jgi:ligand-binding SRPBCC domain-containing protein
VKLYRLHRAQILPVSQEEAWRFFSSPLNLPSITPPWLNLTAVEEVPDSMFPGMVIRYWVKPLLGIPVTWISEITHVDAPHYFVDEQRFGPYRFWLHQHHFRTVSGGIEMIDTVFYSLKYGPLGTLMNAFFIRKRLEEIFDFRQRALEQLFGTEKESMQPVSGPCGSKL